MNPQLSECPNCRRTFIARSRRPWPQDPGRCGACGTPLVSSPGEKEAEVRERLYGHRIGTTRTMPVSGRQEGDGR
jgi:hypothetical protein